jgi:hypothetical protein
VTGVQTCALPIFENNYEIDLKYYFDNQISGQFARLLSYDEEFTVYAPDPDTNQLDYDDAKTLEKCKKYILKLVDQHSNDYILRDKIFKNLYSEISKKYKSVKYSTLDKNTSDLYNKKYDILFNSSKSVKIEECTKDNLYRAINVNIENFININSNISIMANNILKKNKKNISTLNKIYNGKGTSYYNLQKIKFKSDYNSKLDHMLKSIIDNQLEHVVFNIDNVNIINIIQNVRNKYNIDNICGSTQEINTIYDVIDEKELDINISNVELYTKIDSNLIKQIYNDYISLISIKKLILLNEYIYNTIYLDETSSSNNITTPYKFKL